MDQYQQRFDEEEMERFLNGIPAFDPELNNLTVYRNEENEDPKVTEYDNSLANLTDHYFPDANFDGDFISELSYDELPPLFAEDPNFLSEEGEIMMEVDRLLQVPDAAGLRSLLHGKIP